MPKRPPSTPLNDLYRKGGGYAAMMVTRPQTVGYALADSPAGQAAWIYDKFAAWTYTGGEPERVLSKDDMLDDITLYWLTNTRDLVGAALLGEQQQQLQRRNQKTADIAIPVAVTVFPGEIYRAPRSWTAEGLSQPDLLQRGRPGRPLRRLGTAGAVRRRDPRGVQAAAPGKYARED